MAWRRWVSAALVRRPLVLHPPVRSIVRSLSAVKSSDALEEMFAKPSWSVRSLFNSDESSASTLAITQKQLYHFLRLSALPLPTSEAQEAKMIKDLQSQLKFVQAIQQVDTEGVEPLQSIRDETKEAEMENEITVKTLQEAFDKEEVVGRRGRIRRRTDVPAAATDERMKDWDPLSQAPKKLGRLFVVDTAKD